MVKPVISTHAKVEDPSEEKELPKPHGIRYKWIDYFNKGKFTLRYGVDFKGAPHGLASTIRQAARRLKKKVSIMVTTESVSVTVLASNYHTR